MSDPRDRLLDHALREVLGESSEAGADLSRAVREAWENGERRPAPRLIRRSDRHPVAEDPDADPEQRMRGSRPAGGHDMRERRPRRAERAGPRRLAPVAAAATVLLVGGLYAFLANRGPTPDPGPGPSVAGGGPGDAGPAGVGVVPTELVVLARADRPLRVSGEGEETSEVAAGRAAYVPRGAPASIELPDEANLVGAPGTVVAFRAPGAIALGSGSLRVTAGTGPIALELPGDGRLDVPTGSAVLVSLRTDLPDAAGADPAAWLEATAPRARGVLDIVVERGAVQLIRAGADPTSLRAGAEPEVFLVASGTLRRATVDERLIGDGLRGLAAKELAPNVRLELLQGAYREGAFALLRDMPELWPLAEDGVAYLLDPDVMPAFARREVISTLSVDQSPYASRAVRRAWTVEPELFSTDAIVAMAERGAFEFEREADGWLEAWDATAEGDPIPVAMYLALRGDARGVELLRPVSEEGYGDERAGRPLLAAACLARLGDSRTWEDTVSPFASEVRALLEANDLDRASLLVDALAYAIALRDGEGLDGMDGASEWDASAHIGFVGHWIQAYHVRRSIQPRDRAALEEQLRLLEAR